MAKDLWLPKGFELSDGSKIQALLFSGEDWQIYQVDSLARILLTTHELACKWEDSGLIDKSLMDQAKFGASFFRTLTCPKQYALTPVKSGGSPNSKVDAIAFSIALKESRKIIQDTSFHDAIYVEQYSRLLPTWTLSSYVADEVVFGTWITGGVIISAESFRRLSSLVGWMAPSDLAEVVSSAGFQVQADAIVLAKWKTKKGQLKSQKKDIKRTDGKEAQSSDEEAAANLKKFSLPGRPDLEEFFNDHVIDIIFNPEKYEDLGIDFPSAIVLHGPPGCGKTFAVEKLIEFIDWPSFSIDSNSVGSPYIHETSKKISGVFDKAIDAAPSIVTIDEMESFLSDRRFGSTSGLHHIEEVAEFLRRIPEAKKNKVLVIAMTNLIELIDPAILRRGRFDHVVEVGMPSRSEVDSLLHSLLSKLPKSDDLEMTPVLDILVGKPLSDVAFVVRESARLAAKSGKKQIDQESIIKALDSLSKGIKKESGRIGF